MSTRRHRSVRSMMRNGDPEPIAIFHGIHLMLWSWWYALLSLPANPKMMAIISNPFSVLPGYQGSWLASLFTAVGVYWIVTLRRPDASLRRLVFAALAVICCYLWVGFALCGRFPDAWRSTATPVYMGFLPSMVLWSSVRIVRNTWRLRNA